MSYRMAVLGGGRMGEALLGGLFAAGSLTPAEVVVVEVVAERREALGRRFPGLSVLDAPVGAADVLVATKPADVPGALAAARAAGLERVLSIAAGVSTTRLEEAAGPVPVVRAMPNTPALIGEGVSAVAAGRHATDRDLAWAESLLGAVGTVVRVPEAQLDAVTAVSGSGPAYLFLLAEALIEAGVVTGLPPDTAELLVARTLLGSARLLEASADGPEALRAAVTSPGGTTAAAVEVLERRGVRAAVVDAVRAAADRAAELDS
jgi:pyrroline-5-carboxylate reductase